MNKRLNREKNREKMGTKQRRLDICPCRIGEEMAGKKRLPRYSECCEPYHQKSYHQEPYDQDIDLGLPTAEAVMRSRFSAFALNLTDYLFNSWHSATRPEVIEDQADTQWFYLKILATESDIDSMTGIVTDYVTFEARYRFAGKVGKFREKSRFMREDNRLVYVDGIFLD